MVDCDPPAPIVLCGLPCGATPSKDVHDKIARLAEKEKQTDRSHPTEVDGQLLKHALLGSLAWLTPNQEELNRLNVFPVPDGDTGTNMLLTLQSAVEDIRESQASEVSKITKIAARLQQSKP